MGDNIPGHTAYARPGLDCGSMRIRLFMKRRDFLRGD
jgi:hypothetical protein